MLQAFINFARTWYDFRAHLSAAPLKAAVAGSAQPWRQHFRAHLSAAPLKAFRSASQRHHRASFPRSSERGPIEGINSPAFLYRVLKFPRSSERGPIEGPTRSVSCNSAISHFRAHLSAAPLKANANRAAILRRGFISALI